MSPEMGNPARWAIHLAIMIPLFCLAVLARDDSGFGVAYFQPRFGGTLISVYGLWGGVFNVVLLAGLPVAAFALLSRFVAPTRGLKMLVGIALGLLGAFVIALEAVVASEHPVVVTDFTLFPEDALAQRDTAEIQARIDVLKSKRTETFCDEAFVYHEIGTESLSEKVVDQLHREYSFERRVDVGSTSIEIKPSIDLSQVIDLVEARLQCMVRYEKAGDELFGRGEFSRAAQQYRVAAGLAAPGSDDRVRLDAMNAAMNAAAEPGAATRDDR